MTRTQHDQPRGLTLHTRIGPKLTALYATAVNGRRGGEGGNSGERPTPLQSSLVDTQRAAERLFGYLEMLITHVLTGGDSVIRTSGWWGVILCPACSQDTLMHDLGEQCVSCTNPDCDDHGDGPWWESERWLYGRIAALDLDLGGESLTTNERQRQIIDQLRVQSADWRALYEQAMAVLAAHGLTEPQVTQVSSGQRVHVCPETGGEDAR